ncbi:bifunctional 5,10-methylenetetrahydrofolate dehydrogenase/5,10-methenyltetrahydrofolate cyclohydrolase [archaeon]|nr:bifunctional 5,10-methylenetetrahydrofolate dehydrogenase/5,10-methenyltetrahydrofolate cyclohydrolase [archaeon]
MILDGRELSKKIKEDVKKEINSLDFTPCLATLLVGDDPASKIYVKNKDKACEQVGIKSITKNLPTQTTKIQVIQAIEELNNNPSVHAILLQLPLPPQLNAEELVEFIYPSKDVEGFHPVNMGRLVTEKNSIAPCTPAGIIELLKHYEINLKGKDVTVVGHSIVVGKPLALLLLKEWSTVTLCHIETRDLTKHTKHADIVIVAVGKPGLIKEDMVKNNVVLVDVGTTKVDDKIVGDADFEAIKDKASAITPVPGGVGPMTVAMLMKNTVKCAKRNR